LPIPQKQVWSRRASAGNLFLFGVDFSPTGGGDAMGYGWRAAGDFSLLRCAIMRRSAIAASVTLPGLAAFKIHGSGRGEI
jgi:hypothetical protein